MDMAAQIAKDINLRNMPQEYICFNPRLRHLTRSIPYDCITFRARCASATPKREQKLAEVVDPCECAHWNCYDPPAWSPWLLSKLQTKTQTPRSLIAFCRLRVGNLLSGLQVEVAASEISACVVKQCKFLRTMRLLVNRDIYMIDLSSRACSSRRLSLHLQPLRCCTGDRRHDLAIPDLEFSGRQMSHWLTRV